MNKKANTIMEWVILIGVVSLGFITMNTYVKRGLQGKLADMSDYFIGEEHAQDANPTAIVTSNVVSTSDANARSDMSAGGGIRLALLENRDITATSKVVDASDQESAGDFVPQEAGNIEVPELLSAEEAQAAALQGDEYYAFEEANRENKVEMLLEEADKLGEKAAKMEIESHNLSRKASGMDCHGKGSCRRARSNMKQQAQQMLVEAKEMRQEAEAKRAEAAKIQGGEE